MDVTARVAGVLVQMERESGDNELSRTANCERSDVWACEVSLTSEDLWSAIIPFRVE